MTTRSIVTHHPEVACDMCGRRLLRGERPEAFLAAGHRRTVCELCGPRAAVEGWMRASDAHQTPGTRRRRARKGRSLLDRLRQLTASELAAGRSRRTLAEEDELLADGVHFERHAETEAAGVPAGFDHADSGHAPAGFDHADSGHAPAGFDHADSGHAPIRFDHDIDADADAEHAPEWASPAAGAARRPPVAATAGRQTLGGTMLSTEEHVAGDLAAAALLVGDHAVEAFNASECAARVAGIARALGEPTVTVRPAETGERATIVLAWELCWYRYEVDLAGQPPTIALIADGTELHELPGEDRAGNATANERGEIALLR